MDTTMLVLTALGSMICVLQIDDGTCARLKEELAEISLSSGAHLFYNLIYTYTCSSKAGQ
jgi:hypothetical protein